MLTLLVCALIVPARAQIAGPEVWLLLTGPPADPAGLAAAGTDAVALPSKFLASGGAGPEALRDSGLTLLATLSLDGPVPAPDGSHLPPEAVSWLSVRADGTPVEGRPCLAVPAAREALVGLARSVAPQVDAFLLTSLAGSVDGRPAWEAGFNEPVLAAYRQRYGGDPRDAAPGSLEHLLFVRLKATFVTTLARELRAAVDLPIYLAMPAEDQHPETAHRRYIDTRTLLAERLIDGVLLASDGPQDLRRQRLFTPRDIRAGLAVAGPAATTVPALERSRGVDTLLAMPPGDTDPAAWLAQFETARSAYAGQQARRQALAEAIESGELTIVAGAEPEGEVDQATIHGVGQSIRLEETTSVAAVGLYCVLRGPNAMSLPSLRVQICPDAEGRPDVANPVAESTIPPSAFADEGPGYTWGYAEFDPPVELEADRVWWIHCPNAVAGDSSYVWRIVHGGGAYPGGHAWSRSYDYTAHDWAFRVLSRAGGGGR